MSNQVYFVGYVSACTAIACLFAALTFYVFNVVYTIQPNSYIDETFHVPQAQKYCRGMFYQWDPKITTLPGLYLISVGVIKPLSLIFNSDFCSVYGLRGVNLVVSMLNFYLLYILKQTLRQQKSTKQSDKWKDLISAFNLAIFPVLYFFTFFYYTDTLSTFFILLTYQLHLYKRDCLAALIGVMAIVTRQTNIIWIAFFAFNSVVGFLKSEALRRNKKVPLSLEKNWKYLKVLHSTVMETYKCGVYNLGHLFGRMVISTLGYIIVGLSFLLFVYLNGSIVVGDKSAHVAVINLPQIFYYALFISVFSSPFCITQRQKFSVAVMKHWKLFTLCLILCIVIIHFNSIAHPYLLADNRHYTFYIWKRIFDKQFIPYFLSPMYLYWLFCISDILKATSFTFQLSYWACVVLCLVPQKLLEFRYFIIPFLILRLQIQSPAWWQLILESVLYFLINASTLYIFLTKTFYWSDSTEPQRIIW